MSHLSVRQKAKAITLSHEQENLTKQFLASLDIKAQSKETYKRATRRFFIFLEKQNLTNPTGKDILAYKEYLTASGLKALTISHYLVVVRRFFAFLEGLKLYPNIAKGIKGAKQPKGFLKDPLTLEQIGAVLRGIDTRTQSGKRDFALINLLIQTGLRTIEVVRANVGDIRQEGGEALLWILGKGRDSKDEFVVLTQATQKPIQKYLATRGQVKESLPLFASLANKNFGERLTTRSVSRIIKNHLRVLGIDSKRLTAHSLRHTAITLALQSGATIQETQVFGRHSNINTTLRYAHNINRIAQAPEKKIEKFLASVGNLS